MKLLLSVLSILALSLSTPAFSEQTGDAASTSSERTTELGSYFDDCALGEIFEGNYTVIRLAGQPKPQWCVDLSDEETEMYLPIEDCSKLDEYMLTTSDFPARVYLKGFQKIVVTGEPYGRVRCDDEGDPVEPLPQNAYSAKVVLQLLDVGVPNPELDENGDDEDAAEEEPEEDYSEFGMDQDPIVAKWEETLNQAANNCIADEMYVEEVEAAAKAVIAAGKKLYKARLRYGYSSIDVAVDLARYIKDEDKEATRQRLKAEWKGLVGRCMLLDLRSYLSSATWSGEVPTEGIVPKEWEWDPKECKPMLARAIKSRSYGSQMEISMVTSMDTEAWEACQNSLEESIKRHYTDFLELSSSCSLPDWLTDISLKGDKTQADMDSLTEVAELFENAEDVWREYIETMQEHYAAYRVYVGSATWCFWYDCYSDLLSSRDLYLMRILRSMNPDNSANAPAKEESL